MATKPKQPAKKKAAPKKKPAASVAVVKADDGTWFYSVRDEDGKELARGAEGSRNRFWPARVASTEHPDLPVT